MHRVITCTRRAPEGWVTFLSILVLAVGGVPASHLDRHSLRGPPRSTTHPPMTPARWSISGLTWCLPVLPVLWSHACCDTELSHVVRNPSRPLELRGQWCTTGAASFIFRLNAAAELWFLWNAVCVGGGRAKTPCAVLSSVFKATSDCPGSHRLGDQDFFYSLGSKSLLLSSCFALRWQREAAVNLA